MAEKPTISVIEPLKTDLAEAEPARREEFFLDAIAGGTNGEALEPMDRPEEFLRRIAERETYQEGEINRVYDQIPVVPEAGDVGKVLTVVAGEDGKSSKWGAEEPTLPITLRNISHYTAFAAPGSTNTNIAFNIISNNTANISSYIREGGTEAARLQRARERLFIFFNGHLCTPFLSPTTGTIIFRCNEIYSAIYNDITVPLYGDIRVRLTLRSDGLGVWYNVLASSNHLSDEEYCRFYLEDLTSPVSNTQFTVSRATIMQCNSVVSIYGRL